MPRELAELLFTSFRGRDDVFAVSRGNGFRPTTKPITADDVAAYHLPGKTCLGFYFMRPDNRVLCSALDFDGKHEPDWLERVTNVRDWLAGAGFEPLVELSQSGNGAHVWLLFAAPVEAWVARAFWRHVVLPRSGVKCREIYPRQDRLLSGKGLGNLMRYPLWGHSCFVDAEWEKIDPLDALAEATRYDVTDLEELAVRCGSVLKPEPTLLPPPEIGSELPERVRKLVSSGMLQRRWLGDASGLEDQSRSAVAMAFACGLVRAYVPTPEIEIALRQWCDRNGAHEKGKRDDWVRRTIARAYEFILSKQETKSLETLTFRDATRAFFDRLATGELRYAPFGVPKLDRIIDGIGDGEMCIFATRPNQGKSAFGIQWGHEQMLCGRPVLFVSEEMSAEAIGKRCACRIAGYRDEQYTPEMLDEYRKMADAYYEGKPSVYLVNGCSTIDRFVEVVEQHHEAYGIHGVVLDYAQLLSSRGEKLHERVADVSKQTKSLALRLNISVLCLVQPNRQIDQRGRDWFKEPPRMSDLGDSSQFERDADLILWGMWPLRAQIKQIPAGPKGPDGKRTYRNTFANDYFVSVIKRRNGPIKGKAMQHVTFDADAQTFS